MGKLNRDQYQIWKIRTVKNYPQAQNHLFIGKVLNQTISYVRLDCRTYHFGKAISNPKDIKVGIRGVRILPWCRIELINELPNSFDFLKAELKLNDTGQITLSDSTIDCVLLYSYDNRY